MRKLLLCFWLLHIVHGSCPDGFELVRDGQCRGDIGDMTTTRDDKGVEAVAAKCNEIGTEIISIHNEEQQSYWSGRAHSYFMLGLVCNTTSKRWQWYDGSAMDYKPPVHDADCSPTSTFTVHIGCTKQLKQMAPITDSCVNYDEDNDDSVCYEIGESAETWQDAQMNCKKLGANLASIHNSQENAFVRRLAVSNGVVNGLFLGATTSGKGNTFGWIDGTEWDYDNFSPGFPKSGFGDCIAMDTFSTAGQWLNIDCSAKLPVACIRDKITTTASTVTCSTDAWKEGQIITSPGFPYSASMPCDFYLTADAGKKVEVEIILLEANSCCDNLLIFDGYLGGNILANVTGQVTNTTYTTTSSNIMRVVWEQNGGVNVLGLVMTFRGV